MFRSFRLRGVLFFFGTSIALLAMLVGIIAVKVPFQAHAHAATNTLYVSHNTIGSNTSCADPGYNSIQTAVDAANKGDTVYLCGTTPYTEQVIITKAITLTGDNGATIQAPNPFLPTSLSRLPSQFTTDSLTDPQAIVIVWGSTSNVKITNLNIAGPIAGSYGCGSQEYGVLVIANGNVSLKNDNVTNIHDTNTSLYGCQMGLGIEIGSEYWPSATSPYPGKLENFIGTATIQNTVVTGYQKNGITVDGPKSWAEIEKNKVLGSGRDALFAPTIAQNGVQISDGANGKVSYNYIADNSYTGSAFASSAGVIIFGGAGYPLVKGVAVEHNTLVNNDVGIYLNNFSPDPNFTGAATQKTNDMAEYNSISNDARTNVGKAPLIQGTFSGYQTGIEDIGNNDLIEHNTIGGFGYTPTNTTNTSAAFVIPIDTISFPTIHPRVLNNKIN